MVEEVIVKAKDDIVFKWSVRRIHWTGICRIALDQDEYEKRYAELTARYEKAKAKYDDIAEQIESKKAKRELFKGFIRTLEKQDGLTCEFDAGIWSSLVQEVVVKSKDDITFVFKNGFEVRV